MDKRFVITFILLLGCNARNLQFTVKVEHEKEGVGSVVDYNYHSEHDEHNKVTRVSVDDDEKNKKTHVSVPTIAKQNVTLLCTLRNAGDDFTEKMKSRSPNMNKHLHGWKKFDKQMSAEKIKETNRRESYIELPTVEEGKPMLGSAQGIYSCTYDSETIFFYVFIIPSTITEKAIRKQITEDSYDNNKEVEKELHDLRSGLSKFLVENDALIGERLRDYEFSDRTEIDTVQKGISFQRDQKKLLETMKQLDADIEKQQTGLNLKIEDLEKLHREEIQFWKKGKISAADKAEVEKEIREKLLNEIEILKEKEANLKYSQDALAIAIGIWGGIHIIFFLYRLCKRICKKKHEDVVLERDASNDSELSET